MTLLDASGIPLRSAQGIPVIQHTPSGARGLRHIHRPTGIEAAADQFIAQGGRYRVALLDGNQVNFSATIGRGDDIYVLAGETTPNGPEHLDAVDRVVLLSVKHISSVH